MALTLNLEKSAKSLQLCLQKAGILTPPVLDVGVGMDVSKSFEDEHRDGVTDKLATRLVAWGLVFDPDRKIDMMTFSDGASHVHDVGPVDERNYQGFIPNRVVNNVVGWNGGTTYSHVIEKFLSHFGWLGDVVQKAGFFGKLLGQKDRVIAGAKKPSLVTIVTDGDNQDKERTHRVLAESQARGDKVFFLFLGICNGRPNFSFLEGLNAQYSNVSFVEIKDLRAFVDASDDQVNELLVTKKLVQWFGGSGQ